MRCVRVDVGTDGNLADSSYIKAFLPSTRNSDDAHVHLLKAAACTKIFFSKERQTRVVEIQELCPNVEIFQIPTLQQMLANGNGRRSYIYEEAYDDVESHTICIIHSSGTTGKDMLSSTRLKLLSTDHF